MNGKPMVTVAGAIRCDPDPGPLKPAAGIGEQARSGRLGEALAGLAAG